MGLVCLTRFEIRARQLNQVDRLPRGFEPVTLGLKEIPSEVKQIARGLAKSSVVAGFDPFHWLGRFLPVRTAVVMPAAGRTVLATKKAKALAD